MTRPEAERGLAILHYPGKWRQALLLTEKEFHITHPRYWETVRTRFLELGGLMVEQLREEQQQAYRRTPQPVG